MIDFLVKNKFYAICVLFLALATLFIGLEHFWVLIAPVGLLILLALAFKLDKFFYMLFFLTPLSINVENIGGGVGVTFPTEPLIFGLMLFLLVKLMFSKNRKYFHFKHPMSRIILLYIAWLIITTITSSMFMISLKFIMAKIWFILGFYFLGIIVFEENTFKNMKTSLWLYFIPLLGVIAYTLVRHTLFKYDEKAAHWVMQPFFKDHTIYGAILAMLTPFLFFITFKKHKNMNAYIFILFAFIIFGMGLVFSYTRAAWISLVGSFVLYLVLILRVRWFVIVPTVAIGFFVLMSNWDQILIKLERNKQDSSDDLVEHVQSISNIASDASNLERLNRWGSAWRMFQAKPVFGWGPGTYMFQYAPFQHSSQLTIISTNFGDGGSAHSEYLGPLSESGFLGFVFVLLIIAYGYYLAIKNYYLIKDKKLRRLLMAVILGWTTYIGHGVLNNFLDTDKASVLYWSFIAFYVAIDIGVKSGKIESKKATAQ